MDIVGAHALIVDDDPDLRALVKRVLEGAGMHVAEARDVDGAFQAAARSAPHLILSDLNMPGQSGFAFIERCRKTPWLRQVPIVVLSAQNDPASVHRAISLGANEYVIKPFQSAALTQKIRKVLKDREMKRHEFALGELPRVTVSVPCAVTEIGETGLRVESVIRVAEGEPVTLRVPAMDELKLEPSSVRGSPRPPLLRQEGRYLSDAVFAGLDEPAVQRVRHFLRRLT